MSGAHGAWSVRDTIPPRGPPRPARSHPDGSDRAEPSVVPPPAGAGTDELGFGFDFGLDVGFGVGRAVGFAVGLGVGFAVGLGVGLAVGFGVALGAAAITILPGPVIVSGCWGPPVGVTT